MGSASRLTYPVPVEPLHRATGGGLLALVSGVGGGMNPTESPEELVAKREDAIEAWIEAANALGDLGHAIPRPSRRLVLDAAQ